jgi:WD40 repeat protein
MATQWKRLMLIFSAVWFLPAASWQNTDPFPKLQCTISGWSGGIAFSPDGKMLAAGTRETNRSLPGVGINLWDIATGTKLSSLLGQTGVVAFSP